MQILKPGIHFDVAESVYRADPCERPSLTQSLVKTIIAKSPLHAWYAHPRLNPDYRADDDRKFDVGNIAHSLLLGRGKNIVVIEGFDDWRKTAAKDKREEAAAQGKLGVLEKHYGKAQKMVRAAREQLALRGLSHLFDDGNGEVVMIWEWNGVYMRQMLDWLSSDKSIYADYKTTQESAAPQTLGRKMVNDGWHVQSAFAERGLDTLAGIARRKFYFVVQEDEPPYALNVAQIGDDALVMGHKQVDYAFRLWADCIESNIFAGYPLQIQKPEFPGWAENQWLAQEIHEAANDRKPMLESLAGG